MPRPNVSDQRKTKILEVARKIFAHKSLKQVKMQDIARKAGLSVGGVYWYYKSKEDILAALLLQNAERNLALIDRLIETSAPTAQRLKVISEHLIEQVSQLSELYLTGAKYYARLSHSPETRMVMNRIDESYRNGLAVLIEQGISHGEFRSVNAQDVATILIGAYEGLMLLWVMSPQTIQLQESARLTGQLLLTGLERG